MQKTRKIDRAWNRKERRWQLAMRRANKYLQKTAKMQAIMKDASSKQRQITEDLRERNE